MASELIEWRPLSELRQRVEIKPKAKGS